MTYRVRWEELWRSLTAYMSLTIILTVGAVTGIRFVFSGFDSDLLFKHLSLLGYVSLFLGIWVFSAVFSLIVSSFFRIASITIRDGSISGRNYWWRKKVIPLDSVISLEPFSSNGIDAVVVDGGSHGKVFVYLYTEKLDQIVRLLEAHLPAEADT